MCVKKITKFIKHKKDIAELRKIAVKNVKSQEENINHKIE